jgi:hypothetical protein
MDERENRAKEALGDLSKHTDPKEGPIEELVTDTMWTSEYIAIRVTSHGFGVKFACNFTPEETYLAIRNDRKENPDAMYYLYKPVVLGQDRVGVLMGGTLQ